MIDSVRQAVRERIHYLLNQIDAKKARASDMQRELDAFEKIVELMEIEREELQSELDKE